MDAISADTLAKPLSGLNLQADTLGEQLQTSTTAGGRSLLLFVRHYGCLFCREMIADARRASDADANYPAILLFGQGTIAETKSFFADRWPDVPVVCDPEREFYEAFHLHQGSFSQLFGPRVWACAMRTLSHGHGIGKPIGDVWTMPGAFLVESDGTIVWNHTFDHAADHPDFARISTGELDAVVSTGLLR